MVLITLAREMVGTLKKLDAVDQLFALLRMMAIIGGISWTILSPLQDLQKNLLYINIAFFVIYSIILYVVYFSTSFKIRNIYIVALFLDLVFIYLLIKLTGGFFSDFYLAFFLLVALHSFYFGLRFGLIVATLSTVLYLAAGMSSATSGFIQIILRIGFFYLAGISMGLLAAKEEKDKRRINELNAELQRRQSELEMERDKLSNILMGIDAGLVLLSPDLRIRWVNKVIENWFGAQEKLLGQRCEAALWQNRDACHNCAAIRCLDRNKIVRSEIKYEKLNQETLYYRITAAPLPDETGKVEQILELIQDITEEKEWQMNMVHTGKLAAVGELASGVAHEINNPLGSISVCVREITTALNSGEIIKTDYVEINECLKSINEEINRCKKITRGLLDIARRQSRQVNAVDVNQTIRNVVLLVRFKAQKENKQIRLRLSENLPFIIGEGDELAQVFLNLVLNALEFTAPGKAIDIFTLKEDDDHICMRVKDQGVGISPAHMPKIFNPFFTTKPAGEGTGLGLTISLRSVQAHRGHIKVDSIPQKGTTVEVFLPVNGVSGEDNEL